MRCRSISRNLAILASALRTVIGHTAQSILVTSSVAVRESPAKTGDVASSAASTIAAIGSTTVLAQAKEQFFPVLSYRTGAYAPNGIPFANGAPNLSCDFPALEDLASFRVADAARHDLLLDHALAGDRVVVHPATSRSAGGWMSASQCRNRSKAA